MANLANLFQTFNWHSPSWDLFILLAWLVVAVLYAFTAGRGRVIIILFATYVAKLLVVEVPFIKAFVGGRLPESALALQQLIAFGVIFFIVFIFLGRYGFRTSADGRHYGSLLFGLLFAVLQVGLLINIVLTYVTAGANTNFSPLIQTVFVKDPASFIWLIAPLAYLIVLGKHVADPNEI